MAFSLTEDQTQIADSARKLVETQAPIARLRTLRSQPERWSRKCWAAMAEAGWTALCVQERHGGLDLGLTELALVAEAAGRQLAPEPLVSSAVLFASAVQLLGTHAQRDQLLASVADGTRIGALCVADDGRYDAPDRGCVQARIVDGGFIVDGVRSHTLDVTLADTLIVAARGPNGAVTLFVVDANATGITRTPEARVDGRDAATVRFDSVRLAPADILGELGGGLAQLDGALDRGAVGVAAFALGAATRALELTLDYVRTRIQFGVAIGSFQALQHRLAYVFAKVELARSGVLTASRAIDAGAADGPRLASMAKAKACDALELAAKEGIQMFGGVGMTDEYDIGFYLKAHRGLDTWLGDSAHHRARWATLQGY
ncbi:MAG: acyl-CoA/acyl-ACP dehydrogenase [Myxococcales bacterium]|nr:acyl-CoA/acyl-ACP dehydrogenase [Myxococcales bacterium]